MGVIESRRTIIQNQPHIASQSGSIANFSTDVKGLLKKCVVDFVPIQEGTGDPSPSNVRPITGFTGIIVRRNKKNLFNKSSVTYGKWTDANGVIGNNRGGCISSNIPVNPGDSLTVWYNDVQPYSVSIIELDANLNFIQRNHRQWYNASQDQLVPLTVTIGNTTKYVYLQVYTHNAGDTQSSSMLTSEKVQLEIGTTATEYEDYSSSSKSIAFPVMGKNLFDGQYTTGLITNDENQRYFFKSSGTTAKSAIISCLPNTQYTLRKIGYNTSNRFTVATTSTVPENNIDVNLITEQAGSGEKQTTFTTGANDHYLIVYVSTSSEMAEPDMMLEYGSTASTYEPYTTTCYGGSLDANTGVLTVEWKSAVLNDASKWVELPAGQTVNFSYEVDFDRKLHNDSLTGLLCSAFLATVNQNVAYCRWRAATNLKFGIKNGTSMATPLTLADVKQMAEDGDIVICYDIEPQTVQLTPQQIKTLVGVNNIYSNANNGIAIEYWKH